MSDFEPIGAEALRRIQRETGATDLAIVTNLEYIFSPIEIYPLAPVPTLPLREIDAFLVDMDGTSTTTEPLALEALEYMVRRATNRLTVESWPGLDAELDVPHVIGNSNYRHTEFLLERNQSRLDLHSLRSAFFEAIVWSFANVDDAARLNDLRESLRKLGLNELVHDVEFRAATGGRRIDESTAAHLAASIAQRYAGRAKLDNSGAIIAAALDVYYYRYHAQLAVLSANTQGEKNAVRDTTRDDGVTVGVAPMPGYDVFVALVKGWLGADAAPLAPELNGLLDAPQKLEVREAEYRLARLGEHFARQPARLALVTASIAYEARNVMEIVIDEMRRRVREWPLPHSTRERIVSRLGSLDSVFDAFVTANDACEQRLKPHRDLYSLALRKLALPRDRWPACIGLEDTEPGIISLRAAGVGAAIALPNHDTSRQSYARAARVLDGGLPEFILRHQMFLSSHV